MRIEKRLKLKGWVEDLILFSVLVVILVLLITLLYTLHNKEVSNCVNAEYTYYYCVEGLR